MIIRVNKNTGRQPKVQYAALASGTVSAVWYSEEQTQTMKRRNHIKLTREKTDDSKQFDA